MGAESVPVPHGAPLAAEDVVGRQTALETIERRLRLGSSVMVPGPRRTGKTIAAEEILRRLSVGQPRVLTARVDLFSCSTAEEFAVKLTTAVLAERHRAFGTMALSAVGRVREVLERIDVRLRVQDLEVGLGFLSPERTVSEWLDEALALPERLAAAEGCRIVVLIDEFQEVERLGGERLTQRMRAHWQRQKLAAYLLLGSYPTVMSRLFADRHAALYRYADAVPVRPPEPEAWAAYLSGKFMAAGLEIAPAALDLLLEATGGHPDDTVRAANEAFSLARALGRGAVDLDTVHRAVDRTAEWLAPGFYAQLSEADRSGVSRDVLRDLAHGRRPYAGGRDPSTVRRTLERLVARALVEKEGRGQYRFVEPLFARYVRRALG